MLFKDFSIYLQKIEETTLRLEITDFLSQLFSKLSPTEGKLASYLLLGQLAPNYQGIEFNLATKTMIKVVSRAYNLPEEEVKKKYKEIGDLGEVVWQVAEGKETEGKLSIEEVYRHLYKVAKEEGEGSVERKQYLMAELLKQLDPLSSKYVVRIPLGKLRLGFSQLTILDALSWRLVGDKSWRPLLEKAYNVRSDIGIIVEMILNHLQKKEKLEVLKELLAKMTVQPGIPIRPALASRLPSFEEIIAKLPQAGVEPKYDGLRTQIHAWREKGRKKDSLFSKETDVKVKIFSRNLEDLTPMFPEIKESAIELVERSNLQGVILDSESISFDPQTGRFYPFQETIKRKRKYNVAELRRQRPVRTYVFDILYFDGEDLLTQPLSKRRSYLNKILAKPVGCLNLTPQHLVKDKKEMETLFEEYVSAGLEGIMVKKIDSVYQAGARNFNWVKFKPSALTSVEDTFDLVVLGWYQGKGKRNKFGIGAFLVGVYNPRDDNYLTVSKIGTGLTDDQWRELHKRCLEIKAPHKPANYVVPKELACDFWTEPSLVVEIKADEITRSPLHTSGYALRFPRLVRFRDDKLPTQATTPEEMKEMMEG